MKLVAASILAVALVALPASAGRLPVVASQDWWPVWSPDAQWVAFTRVDGSGRRFTLEVVPAGGGRVRPLAQAHSQLLPSWSADSTHLAYQADGAVFTVSRDGSDRRRVATGLFPDWAPTGAIAYVRAGVLRVGARELASGVIAQPDWSPDGSAIAFARADGVYIAALTGQTRLFASTSTEPTAPTWTLDGSQIAYSDGSSVYVGSTDGTAPARRVAGPYRTLSAPGWSPFGDAVIYTADGRVRTTWTEGSRGTEVGDAAGVGAAFSPGDLNGYRPAVSVPLARCPGHTGIDDGVALSGSCTITGTSGDDVIEGTTAKGDVVAAGRGNDRVHVADSRRDRVDCGPGRDTVWADRADNLAHCEVVYR